MNWTEEEYQAYLARQSPHRSAFTNPSVSMAERALQATIRQVALASGWLYYHTYDSRRSDWGFPDTVLARPGRLIFAELKSATGKPTQEQLVWLDILSKSVTGVETYLWRPGDRETALACLQRKESHP